MKYKLVYIEWVDAYQDVEGGWRTEDDIDMWLEKYGDFVIKQCGWLIKVEKEFIVIASEIHKGHDEDDLPQFSLIQKIPKPWIKKRKVIKI